MLSNANKIISMSISPPSRNNILAYTGSTSNTPILDIPHKTVRKITCLGSGFVGGELSRIFSRKAVLPVANILQGPTSAVTAFKSNVEVTVVDINPDRIAAWKSDSLPIYEPGLQDIVRAARDGIPFYDGSRTANCVAREGTSCFSKTTNAKGFRRQPNLYFSTDVDQAIKDADLIFVCVNTPTKANGIGKGAAADLGYVEAATRNIAKVAMENKIVVEKSTVPCRTAQSIREIVRLQHLPTLI